MSIGQVVLVTFGFLIASFLVFIFGMWVGKDIAERRLAQEERVFHAPVAHPTAEVVAQEALPTVAEQRPKGNTPAPLFQLPLDVQRTPTPIPFQPTSTPTQHFVVLTPIRTVSRPEPTIAERAAPAQPPSNGDQWADAGWTVQVTATTEAANAEAIAARLRSRGYDAYTIMAPNRGQTWYRVRVGRFNDRTAAQQMEARLKSTENLSSAFVTAR